MRSFGFTLLEVMIALAILSIVAIAFLRSQAGSVRLLDEAGYISLATLLAKEKMAELESKGFSEPGKSSGEGEGSFPGFKWERIVSATEVWNVQKVQIKVLWKDGNNDRSLELITYLAKR
ncbi:MAG: type II secretion system minor pseudopilin GspI [Thermodesulfobacteriota bacterium]